jgi:cysteine sulfinate desulfinase/cysteine desulfurase-like protein/rhodanese-related sulfurtransferase
MERGGKNFLTSALSFPLGSKILGFDRNIAMFGQCPTPLKRTLPGQFHRRFDTPPPHERICRCFNTQDGDWKIPCRLWESLALQLDHVMTLDEREKNLSSRLQSTVYLDCNATTHTHPLALQTAREAMELCYGNPSSTHITGLHAKSFLESAREAAAVAVGAHDADEIIFNSGATEGIQSSVFSVLFHLLRQFRETGRLLRWHILYGATEHKAVPAAIQHWSEVLGLPVEIEAIPVDPKGLLDLSFIESRLAKTALICTMAVNNETGVIQPLDSISELLASSDGQGCFWFVDGVQALGKVPIQLSRLGAHYSCFSGHKLNAPKGIGFLWVHKDAPYTPMIVGGGQERGKRSGTENLPGAAAFGRILKALNDANDRIFMNHSQLEECRQKLIITLSRCFPTLVWNADLKHCVPTTLNFSVEGISSRELMNALDAAGVRVSGGSACSSGKTSESHVLSAMNLPKWRSQNAIRMSFGPANTPSEIDVACMAIEQAGEALRASCMIPALPARADQVAEFLKHTGPGISELRASDGTRAWLVTAAGGESVLVADCDQALHELNNKLSCRGLQHTHILRLDKPQASSLPEGWRQIKTQSGTSLLLESAPVTFTASSSTTKENTAVLFAPMRECLEEITQNKGSSLGEAKMLLACFACEPSAMTAYDFVCIQQADSETSVPNTKKNAEAPASDSSKTINLNSRVECTKEELSQLLFQQEFTVLDVREAFESATSHLDEIMNQLLQPHEKGRISGPSELKFRILPLSRLPQFLIERLSEPRNERILCVCRSGQRSLQAAELLRRLPGCAAHSLKGGLADLLAPSVSLPPRSVIPFFNDK